MIVLLLIDILDTDMRTAWRGTKAMRSSAVDRSLTPTPCKSRRVLYWGTFLEIELNFIFLLFLFLRHKWKEEILFSGRRFHSLESGPFCKRECVFIYCPRNHWCFFFGWPCHCKETYKNCTDGFCDGTRQRLWSDFDGKQVFCSVQHYAFQNQNFQLLPFDSSSDVRCK